MKIQPQKNSSLPKYAAVIAAAVSAGLMSGFAAAQPAAQPVAASPEDNTPDGANPYNDWEDVELAGVMPVTTDTECPTELEGTSPVIRDTTEEPTELYLAGEPVIESDTTMLEGTSPVIQDTTEPDYHTELEGTSPVIYDTTEPEYPTELAGTYPMVTEPPTTEELRIEGETCIPTDTTEEEYPELALEGTYPMVTDTTEPEEPKHQLTDVVRLQKFLLGKERVPKSQRPQLDLNGDGDIDVFDLALMKRELLSD